MSKVPFYLQREHQLRIYVSTMKIAQMTHASSITHSGLKRYASILPKAPVETLKDVKSST
jgi:hypothetical protein